MCAPSPPKVQPIPDRQPLQLPGNGDPNAITSPLLPSGNRLRTSAMIFANKTGALGAPSIAAPLGTRGS